MGRQRGDAEVGGGEGEDFEGEYFRFDHHEAGKGEFDHRNPILEGLPREAVPAGHALFTEEAHVDEKAKGEEIIGDGDCDGGPDEPPIEFPDEEPVHEGIEGGAE